MKGFSDEVTFKLHPKAGMGKSQLCEEQENILDRGNNACQGPEPGKILMC